VKHHICYIASVLLAVGQVNAQEPGTMTASTDIVIHTKPMSEDYESTTLEFPAHVSVSRDSDMCVEFYMINFKEEPVFYCGPPGRNIYYPWRMHLVRCDNGASVPYLDSGCRSLPRKEDGTLLETGDGVLCRLPLKDAFGAEDLPPGKYQLKIEYQVTGNLREWIELGYSPGTFTRTIMLIDVVDTEESAGSSMWLLLWGCVAAVCVVLGVCITRCCKMKTFQASKMRLQANRGPMNDTPPPRSMPCNSEKAVASGK
jgi:hypothetical protein